MDKISIDQYNSLIQKIYEVFMAMPDMGMGEMGEARDQATNTVDEWMEANAIVLDEPAVPDGWDKVEGGESYDVISERSTFSAMAGGTDGG
jgi:hypothetical protein